MSQGHIKLHRRIQDNALWLSEKFTEGQAWVDLLVLANSRDGLITKRGIRLEIKRGELGWSEIALGKRWQWSRGKVRRYILYLVQQNMIKAVQQNNKITTHIKIINYDAYQLGDTSNGTTDGHETVPEQSSKTTKRNTTTKKEAPSKKIYGEYKNVRLTDGQLEKLKVKFNSKAEFWIRELSEGKERKGYSYKSDYLAILKWADREEKSTRKEALPHSSWDDWGGKGI